ncbi:ATP-binding protein [Vibrio sp. 10N.222.54.C3]|uniref:ATP-binding protein n=1 Tax=Vibrio sp. 10N.222.54.C3 TaxID=3229640 RepID=UPI00354DDF6A
MTNSNNSVQIKINENNFLSNLGAIFSNTGKVINELIQNASRANATTISFTTSVENGRACLTILDDGSGIADMQKLLSIAESGWSSDVDKCNPYGMGFLSTLFACEHIKIQSQNRMLSSSTEDIVSGESIEIEDSLHGNGTLIEMEGVTDALFNYLTSTAYNREIDQVGAGYDIDVVLNGKILAKTHSRVVLDDIGNLVKSKFSFGTIYFNPEIDKLSWIAYLQGAFIANNYNSVQSRTLQPDHIVHLDDSVRARMPDRAELLDSEEIKKSIHVEMKKLMQNSLQQKLNELGSEAFAANSTLWKCAINYAPELLNDIDFLTESEIEESTTYELALAGHDAVTHSQLEQPISRTDVESSLLFAFPEREEEYETININYLMGLDNVVFVDTQKLHKDHWIHNCTIRYVEDLKVDIQLSNPSPTEILNGFYSISIVLCDEYTLSGEYGDVIINDDAAVASDQTLVIPAKEDLSMALRIYGSYEDEWNCYCESDMDRDIYLLEKLYMKLRAESPEVLIQRVLDDAFMGSGLKNTLNNLKFSISFSGTDIVVTETK